MSMHRSNVVNFSAGPAALPTAVLERCQADLLNWQDTGMSVLEIGHRTDNFAEMADKIRENAAKILDIPDHYDILFLPGGASMQAAAVPMNLCQPTDHAQYMISGHWSRKAAAVASAYADVNEDNILFNHPATDVLPASEWSFDSSARYCHITNNETISGIRLETPSSCPVPLVADMSSCLMSEPIDVNAYQLIYACAQKNLGPSGVTLVIVDTHNLPEAQKITPPVINYALQSAQKSLVNTPPVFSIYVCGLMFEWLIAQGGLRVMQKRNAEKSALLYDLIDDSRLYQNHIAKAARSPMNVTFTLPTDELTHTFVQGAASAGMLGLRGHRAHGGIRVSLYNAIEKTQVERLLNFMQDFEIKHRAAGTGS